VDAGGLNVGLFLITGRAPKTFSWQFFTWDHLGSVRVITDVSGFEIAESRFLPYGDEIPTNTSPITDNTHRFTSHERDAESGGDYMRARYFTSRLASFLSPDPLPGTITSPHTLNSYSYVRRNPLNFLDRHGLSPNPAAPAPIIDTCVTCGAHRREQNDVPGLEPAGDSNDTLSPSQVTQLVKNGGGSIDTVLSDDFVNGTQEQRDEAYKEQAALKDGLTPGTKRFFFLLGVDIETELTPGNGVVIDLSKSSVNGPGQTTDAGEILLSEKRIHALDDPSKGFQATLLHEHAHLGALQRYGSITADSIVWPGLRDKIFRQVDSFAKTLHLWGDGYIGLAAEQIQYGRVELWNH